MSDRPSPYRIGGCALIAIYSDPHSPIHSHSQDDSTSTATTATIGSYLEMVVTAKVSSNFSLSTTTSTTTTAIEANNRNGGFIHTTTSSSSLSSLLRDIYHLDETTRTTVATTTTTKFGRVLARSLFQTLQLASMSVDSMIDLMSSLEHAVHQDAVVDADSLNGLYVRQVCLGFNELSFESVTLLWNHYHSELNL